MKKEGKHIGLIGLGVMGQNLAINMERNGFSVCAYDLDPGKLEKSRAIFKGKSISVKPGLKEFTAALETPKKILMMVPASNLDTLISDLKPFLSKGDVLIDGGNSFFLDTGRREKELLREGIRFMGTGISGGEEGALRGPAIMSGGNHEAWMLTRHIFQAIAAKMPGSTACCEWLGPDGAGHFVKMVHNGIEYGDMQIICEAYFLMERYLGLEPAEMHEIFSTWNEGELNSYLIEITGRIMAKKDSETGKAMIHVILDTAGQKGTGKWTSQVALDLGVPVPTIAEAVFARTMSALKEERVLVSGQLDGPQVRFHGDKKKLIETIRRALYASKICTYAQGFHLLNTASREYDWGLDLGQIALLWRGGCIIRARFLDKIKAAYDMQPELSNLLLDPYFKKSIQDNLEAWRQVVVQAISAGIPIPAFTSALAYYDSYRSARLPANLLQAQRDFFGAHTYERVDRPRGQFFHTDWITTK